MSTRPSSWPRLPVRTGDGRASIRPSDGYRLVFDAWGSGFATELSRSMLERGFDTLKLDRIIGVTHPDNHASQRVLAKVGMRDEGWGRYYDRDLRLFAIDRERWTSAVRSRAAR